MLTFLIIIIGIDLFLVLSVKNLKKLEISFKCVTLEEHTHLYMLYTTFTYIRPLLYVIIRKYNKSS